uniref:Osteocalcin n=1 Tax=Gopherus evgoodei TaxID=1825980 RepID=A0A8C4YDL7_9SAUR
TRQAFLYLGLVLSAKAPLEATAAGPALWGTELLPLRATVVYFYDLIHDPLEGKREICELNPDCDELADHIGFQEAYRRYYGPV